MYIGVSLTSRGKGFSLALVDQFSSDVTIKIPYGVDVLLHGPHTLSFPIRLVKTESNFIVRLAETGLGKLKLAVAVISVDAYPFLAFSDMNCHLEDKERYFLDALCLLIVNRLNLKVAIKSLLYQQIKIPG